MKNLETVFRPESIAVIGASKHAEKIGHQIFKNLVQGGYEGKLYPIHPTEQDILGRKVYKSLGDIQGPVDLAIIAIPAPHVLRVINDCIQKQVKSVSVISSGFAEVGNVKAEHELRHLADANNMVLLGPNTFGVVYAPARLNASFGPSIILPGKIAFISQSGALAIALMGWTAMEKIGLASLVNLGNKAGLEEKDLIEFFNDDPNVDVVLVYMEGLKNGKAFMQTKTKKPVVILKVGVSERGAKAAASHTGSLAGADKVYEAAFKQLGMLRAHSFTEAFGWSRSLSLPAPKGKDTVIITNGGGIGVRTTDECDHFGIKLLDDPDWLEKKFRPYMPSFGSTKNPVDITGGGGVEGYRKAIEVALQEERIHAIIVLYCETAITNPIDIAVAVEDEYQKRGRNKPITVAMVGGERTRDALYFLNEHRIPGFSSITEAVSSLKILYRWQDIVHRDRDGDFDVKPPQKVVELIESVRKEGRTVLLEHEAREVLELCGVPAPKAGFAKTADEAVRVAQGMYPLAMKIASPDIIHKTEVDGVVLNIRNDDELRAKFQNLMAHVRQLRPEARLEGVNLVSMVKGIECIVGLHEDSQFGPAVMFGLGGIFVEALKDVAFRIVPFGENEALRLIHDIRGREILNGFRGYQAHKYTIVQTLLGIQKLAGLVKEVDINPLITNQQGSFAVDARIII